jgi:hypothetical protein
LPVASFFFFNIFKPLLFMKTRYRFIILSACLLGIHCNAYQGSTITTNTPTAKKVLTPTELVPFGRYTVNDKQLELVSSAAHFGFRFQGKECEILATVAGADQHNYLQYELDGVYQKRIRINGNSQQHIVITAPSNGSHTIWVYKATEAHTGPIYIQSIKGNDVQALQRPSAPVIEFIGNSITCGAAADPSEVPCGTGDYHDQHNAYYAYGPRVARTLGTNFILSSVSGIGAYRNWNSDGPTMPQVYEKVDFQEDNPNRWDFSKYAPAVVSIALGTNDFSHGDGIKKRLPFDSTAFVNNYISFVKLVKSKYPKTQIALLSSPMLNGAYRQSLQNCLTTIKRSIDAVYPDSKPVAVFFFEPMQARGCTGHPNVEDHAILAKQLEPFFRKLLQQ